MRSRKFIVAVSLLFTASSIFAQTRQLDTLVITATRAGNKTPVAQSTIYQQQIDNQRVGREMPYLLEMLPSMVSYSDNGTSIGSTSFRIRGTDQSRTNISIDGIPLNDAESQNVFWVNIPDLGAISKSLQVQRGAGTTPFGGSAFGGLLNIETRETPLSAQASFESSYGSFNTWNVAANAATGLLNNSFAFDAHYEYVSSDGYLYNSGLWQQSMNINGRWQGKNHLLRASVLYGEQHSHLTYEGVPFDSLASNRRYNLSGIYGNNQYYPNETDNYQQLHANIHYTQKLSDTWKFNATLYYTKGKGYYEQYKEAAKLQKYGLPSQLIDGIAHEKSDLIRQKGLDNDFYGLNVAAFYDMKRVHAIFGGAASRYDGGHYGKVTWAKYNTGNIPFNYDWYDNTGVKEEYSVFAKASYDVVKALSLFADVQMRGVRFNMEGMDDDYYEKQPYGMLDTTYNWLFVNPKIGLTYTPSTHHHAFLSFAIANREPNRSDLKDADKNGIRTPAQAERLYDLEAGYSFRPSFGQFSAVLYYMKYQNQIVATGRVNDAYRLIMENIPDSYRAGIELTAAVRPIRPLQLEAAFTWSRNKLKDYTNYVDEDYGTTERAEYFDETDIAYSPDMVGSVALRWFPLTDLSVALTGKYVSKQYYDNTANDSRSIDPYFVSNFQTNYDFGIANKMHCFIQFSVNNLFNTKFCSWAFVNYRSTFSDGSPDEQDLRYFPQATINCMMKIGLKF